jgi:hypothetical protein
VLATELFKEGRALMSQGSYAAACPKLEESQRLDPGGGTLLNLALCHELEGRTATAWSEFHASLAFARLDGRDDREEQARHHIDALEPRLVRLTISVRPEDQIPDLAVSCDDSPIGSPAWGAAIPVDPGQHVIEAQAPGHVAWRVAVDLATEGTSQTVRIPLLESQVVLPEVPGPSARVPSLARVQMPPVAVAPLQPETSHRPGTARRTAAWVGAGTAALALAAGTMLTFYEADRVSHYNDDAECGSQPGLPRSQRCAGYASQFRAAQAGAITSFAVAGVAAVTSTVLFLTREGPPPVLAKVPCEPVWAGVTCVWPF